MHCIPILEYHDLGSDLDDRYPSHAPYLLPMVQFEHQMTLLNSQGISTVTIDEILQGTANEKCVVLTFDDGHISNYELALPILKHLGFRATFFLIGERIGAAEHLSITEMREMLRAGMEFGSHSMTHPYMDSLNESEISKEMTTSRTALQSLLHREIRHFSVPYGFYDRRAVVCARQAGYATFLTEDFGYWKRRGAEIAVLPRITVTRGTSLREFTSLVERRAGAVAMRYARWQALAVAKKLLGRKRYVRLRGRILGEATPRAS